METSNNALSIAYLIFHHQNAQYKSFQTSGENCLISRKRISRVCRFHFRHGSARVTNGARSRARLTILGLKTGIWASKRTKSSHLNPPASLSVYFRAVTSTDYGSGRPVSVSEVVRTRVWPPDLEAWPLDDQQGWCQDLFVMLWDRRVGVGTESKYDTVAYHDGHGWCWQLIYCMLNNRYVFLGSTITESEKYAGFQKDLCRWKIVDLIFTSCVPSLLLNQLWHDSNYRNVRDNAS